MQLKLNNYAGLLVNVHLESLFKELCLTENISSLTLQLLKARFISFNVFIHIFNLLV